MSNRRFHAGLSLHRPLSEISQSSDSQLGCPEIPLRVLQHLALVREFFSPNLAPHACPSYLSSTHNYSSGDSCHCCSSPLPSILTHPTLWAMGCYRCAGGYGVGAMLFSLACLPCSFCALRASGRGCGGKCLLVPVGESPEEQHQWWGLLLASQVQTGGEGRVGWSPAPNALSWHQLHQWFSFFLALRHSSIKKKKLEYSSVILNWDADNFRKVMEGCLEVRRLRTTELEFHSKEEALSRSYASL